MREQPVDCARYEGERRPGWLFWPERHAGMVLFGTLVVAILALRKSPPAADVETDALGEDVPLFV